MLLSLPFLLASVLPPLALVIAFWLVQRRTGNAGLADAGWCFSTAWLAACFAAFAEAPTATRVLVGTMGAVWGLRLGTFILSNRVLGQPEEGRYRDLRQAKGDRAQAFFFAWFLAQLLLALLVSTSFWAALSTGRPVAGWTELLAGLTWLAAVSGEAAADSQLARFRANPANRGRSCRDGWWRYSRHPNYFFEWLHWWAYAVMAWGSGWFWLSLLSPAIMLLFLFRVSGIPLTEAQALRSRGEDYRAYQRETSVFIPWFPSGKAGGAGPGD